MSRERTRALHIYLSLTGIVWPCVNHIGWGSIETKRKTYNVCMYVTKKSAFVKILSAVKVGKFATI